VVERDWKLGMDALWRVRAWTERNPEIVVIAGHEPSNVRRLAEWQSVLIGSGEALAAP
jgi:hypothetical protein